MHSTIKYDQKKFNVTIKTWKAANLDGIHNYKDSSNINIIIFKINKNCYMIRNCDDIIVKKNQQSEFDSEEDDEILFFIRKSFRTGLFELINPINKKIIKDIYNTNNLNNRLWYVIKSKEINNENDNEDYILNENDIIKIGRVKFDIIKININSNKKNILSHNNTDNYNICELNKKIGPIFDINLKRNQYIDMEKGEEREKNKTKEKKHKLVNNNKNNSMPIFSNVINNKEILKQSDYLLLKEIFEKIQKYINNSKNEEIKEEKKCSKCYKIESTKDNPKLCLCSCKNYIHYKCLKEYISSNLKINENEKLTVKTYFCDKFCCDICLSPYPLRFRIPEYDRIYELIDLKITSKIDYIILESLEYNQNKSNIKKVHIVKLKGDEITIGRKETNDLVLTDISVSRNHAILKYNKDNGKLILENLSDKFGTLVLIKGNIKMKEKKIHLQSGKSYIVANVEPDISNDTITSKDSFFN